MEGKIELATLAGGCFWCTEAVFKRLKGVGDVVSGYAGGDAPNPSYEEVAGGKTGHAEAVQITFEPRTISFEKILEVFWAMHDPTTPNRQGNDVGEQYRSVIFYHSPEQKRIAEKSKENESHKYGDDIVTSIEAYTDFYPAETEHQDFYDSNRNYGYCRLVIDPKIKKLCKDFEDLAEKK